MEFRTELKPEPFKNKINYKHKLLFLGSCFAENISRYFEYYRFQVNTNPFGILYHPLAIKKIVDVALDSDYQPEEQSFQHGELWSNFDAHSCLSHLDKKQLISNLNIAQQQTHKALKESDFIFITLGTAWVYKHLANNTIVNNCHKLPQTQFEKQLMKLEDVEKGLHETLESIQQINPDVQIIFTLSPVRHLKDGFVENQYSKSTLYLGIQNTIEHFHNLHYFQSYELLLDDLRDYRFYDSDHVHPNRLATDYIWSKLKDTFLTEETLKLIKQIEAINKRLDHRFFNPKSKDSLAFKTETENIIDEIKKEYPYINFK